MKLDYYANSHIIGTIYSTFENIELLPFSSENLFLMLYKYSSEQAEILKEINIYAKSQLICIKYANIFNKYVIFTQIVHVLPCKKCGVKHEGVQFPKLLINYATKHIVCKILNIDSGCFKDIY